MYSYTHYGIIHISLSPHICTDTMTYRMSPIVLPRPRFPAGVPSFSPSCCPCWPGCFDGRCTARVRACSSAHTTVPVVLASPALPSPPLPSPRARKIMSVSDNGPRLTLGNPTASMSLPCASTRLPFGNNAVKAAKMALYSTWNDRNATFLSSSYTMMGSHHTPLSTCHHHITPCAVDLLLFIQPRCLSCPFLRSSVTTAIAPSCLP